MTIEAGTQATPPRRLRLGMVGGGRGAFIGAVHRIAARLDDQYELVAGALSSEPERAKLSAADLALAPERGYGSYAEMARAEAARADGIEVVSVVTPNHMHHAVARAFLDAGIEVICDKPMTRTLEEARDLADAVARSERVFVLTHNYTGYPMVRQAREMVRGGELGAIRVVQVEYPQDWLSTAIEAEGQKQAAWRTDPAQSGAGGSVGDLGTHAFNLAEFITGLRCVEVAGDLSRFVAGRRLDDNAHVLLRFEGGARGVLWSSQVAPGSENALRIRVFGEKGGLAWEQEHPNHLHVMPLGGLPAVITRGSAAAGGAAARATRIPPGHPEGYLEGFAQIYRDAAELIRAKREGRAPAPDCALLPGVAEGVRGVAFVSAVVESSANNAGWRAIAA
jgi:predicted dehydrogenase